MNTPFQTPFGLLSGEPVRDFEKVPPAQRRSGCDDDDPSLPGLWKSACGLYDALLMTFGDATGVAGVLELDAFGRKHLPDWLGSLEKLVRGLILAAALMLQGARRPLLPSTGARPPRPDSGRDGVQDGIHDNTLSIDEPQTWPALFRTSRLVLIDGEVVCAPARLRGAPSPPPIRAALHWTLAVRIEALRRVLLNPHPHIRRLAARIARGEQRTLAPFAFMAPVPPVLDRDRRPYLAGWHCQRIHEHITAAVEARKPEG